MFAVEQWCVEVGVCRLVAGCKAIEDIVHHDSIVDGSSVALDVRIFGIKVPGTMDIFGVGMVKYMAKATFYQLLS